MIPEKDTDLNEIKNAELFEYLKAEAGKETPDKDLTGKITRKITEINNAYFDNTIKTMTEGDYNFTVNPYPCLLYTSPSPRDGLLSRMPSSA